MGCLLLQWLERLQGLWQDISHQQPCWNYLLHLWPVAMGHLNQLGEKAFLPDLPYSPRARLPWLRLLCSRSLPWHVGRHCTR